MKNAAKVAGDTGPLSSEKQEEEWRAESDLRTLIDAEKIKSDKPRLKKAMAKRDEMSKNLTAIKG